jgi:hypothetical protein
MARKGEDPRVATGVDPAKTIKKPPIKRALVNNLPAI